MKELKDLVEANGGNWNDFVTEHGNDILRAMVHGDQQVLADALVFAVPAITQVEADAIADRQKVNPTFVFPLSGQWLLDPNEVNGWGVLGPYDNTNSQDVGDVDGTPNPLTQNNAGGLCFPQDVKIKRLFAWHRNSNNLAQAWGWYVFRQVKSPTSNVATGVVMLDEVADNGGTGPRDYSNTVNQNTDVTTFTNDVIPAGEVINLAVAAPTANATNYYVQIKSGYIEFEYV